MIKSQTTKHREADQSDKHCLVCGVENLMVDGRGKVRPFGLVKPKVAPTLEIDESGGELRRDAGYSYRISYFDSYHNAESEPSPATEYVKCPGGSFDTVSFGQDEVSGDFNLAVVKVAGDGLSKIDGHYVGQCIAVLIENNDRPTPYSQWQYRKVKSYKWDGANEVGEFEVSRPFVNVDTDPEDQHYQVRLSDMDMEEGEVGGKSAGDRKLILDPTASTDVSSYRLKVIRIVQGVGKGQSRFIMDACVNAYGLVEITVNKPWEKKPKFVDATKAEVQEKQDSLKGKKDAKPRFFNQNWSSSYVIFDPLRYNGLCFDGEVEYVDKKTGRITIAGLATRQSILTGNVIRFMQGVEGKSKKEPGSPAKMVISLENSNTNIGWAEDNSLANKRIRITGGPGAGKEWTITASEDSGEGAVKLTLGVPSVRDNETDVGSVQLSGIPSAKSTYVIYTSDESNDSDLSVAKPGSDTTDPENAWKTVEWNRQQGTQNTNISVSMDADGHLLVGTTGTDLGSVETWQGKKIELVGVTSSGFAGATWASNITIAKLDNVGTHKYRIYVNGKPPWIPSTSVGAYKNYQINYAYYVKIYNTASGSGTYKEEAEPDGVGGKTKIYISDIKDTGIWEFKPTDEITEEKAGIGNGNNAIVVDGLYTASIQVRTQKKAKGKKYTARITRFIHEVGIDNQGHHYITVIGLLPRLYKKPRKADFSALDNVPDILEPEPDSKINVYGSASRDGFYTGWRALFYNTSEIGGDKQRFKAKDARVSASFDATGEILVDKEIAGVKPGWQCVLYSEYTSCLGTCINTSEQSSFYRQGSADYGVYDDYVPLEPFASSTDDEYNGWTLEVLTKGKTKKDGSTKYTAAPTKYRNKQKRTIIDYYGASRRAYVYKPYDNENAWHELDGKPFDPKLNGNEFIWLYDPATSIEKMFEEDSDESVVNDFGIKIKVKGIKMSPLDGVDKIRLYRAPEATGAYRLVVDLENKDQEYVDNIPEEHLSTEIDIGHVPPPPCSKVCEYKGRFVMGGAIDNAPTAYFTKGSHASSYVPDYGSVGTIPSPIVEEYLYTDGKTFNGKVIKTSPAIGVLLNNDVGMVISQTDDTNTENIKINLAISEPTSDGVIAWCEQKQFSGTFQRSRVSADVKNHITEFNTDWVFLSTSASATPTDYKKSVLCFENYSKNQECWPFYYSSNGTRYTAQNKQFVWLGGEKVPLPIVAATVYPSPFTIRTSLWVIYRKDSKYYLYDVKNKTPKEITPQVSNDIMFISTEVNQGENFRGLSYHIGGNAKQAVAPEFFGYGDVSSASFRMFATIFALDNEDIVSCYLGTDAEIQTYQEPKKESPILAIPECIENSHSASVYSNDGRTPEDPPIKATHKYDGSLVWIAIWDKEYMGSGSGTETSLSSRDNARAVYVTSATDGDVEKVMLENVFVLNDGFGTDVTAIATWLDKCYVFKQRGIYGLDPDAKSLNIISNDIGCIATDSMSKGRSGLYWLAEGRRFVRANFESELVYIGAPLQPWLDGVKDFDGWYVDKDNMLSMISTYDVDADEYVVFVPAKKGQQSKLICLCFNDQHEMWYRVEDDALNSNNLADCAFRFEGRAAYAGANGIWEYRDKRSGYAAWLWKSIQRDEGNSGYIKHIKRLQIINVVSPDVQGNPTAKFKFYKEMRTTAEGSYQARDGHTEREFYTNKFSQLIHVGLRALMWQFEFFGTSYLKLHDFVLQYRKKGESEVEWGSTKN